MKRTSSIREHRSDLRLSNSGRFVLRFCASCKHEAKCPFLSMALVNGLVVIADECDRFARKIK
jgi:hypothetical protein